MSFLNQLKSQANALQSQQSAELQNFEASTAQTERAGQIVWHYLVDLARQLNVIAPAGPTLTLDNKTPWPEMKLIEFRVDARKKQLRDKEVYDYLAMGWRMVPREGEPVQGSVSANFPPDLQRIEARLFSGNVQHERVNVRHPEKNTLQAIRFDYLTEARASITITADHAAGQLAFRLTNLQNLETVTVAYPVAQIQGVLLDELARLIVGQSSRFAWGPGERAISSPAL